MPPFARPACVFLALCLGLLSSCQKLDEDGGYYDKEKGKYIYVQPSKKPVSMAQATVKQPRDGERQEFQAKILKIDNNLKSVWVIMEDRKSYQILAERMAAGNRHDENKLLKINLSYVSPLGSLVNRNLRNQWFSTVQPVLQRQLEERTGFFSVVFEGQSKSFWGEVNLIVISDQGERLRNFNLWMIYEGLSYYIIERGQAPDHDAYLQAQRLAKKRQAGLWKYQ